MLPKRPMADSAQDAFDAAAAITHSIGSTRQPRAGARWALGWKRELAGSSPIRSPCSSTFRRSSLRVRISGKLSRYPRSSAADATDGRARPGRYHR